MEKFNISKIEILKNTLVEKQLPFQNNKKPITKQLLDENHQFISDITFSKGNLKFHTDFLQRIPLTPKANVFAYIPILVVHHEKNVPTAYKLLISGIVEILNKIQANKISYGRILYGDKLKSFRVNHLTYQSKYHTAINEIKINSEPNLFLNSHCNSCEFHKYCRLEAEKQDNLSLLRGIPKKKIEKLNKKGIFTVNQLSYTYRPKRKSKKRTFNLSVTKSFELQAYSIRTKKIHVINTPVIPECDVKIYFDIEGIPEENFNYLIGLKVVRVNKSSEFSFWADTGNDEKMIIQKFINVILTYNSPIIYHYGSYEIKFLNNCKKRYPEYKHDIDKIISYCFDVLKVLYGNIYFPTYSNGLKEIGNYLGFRWSIEKSSGLQSVFWRRKWEETMESSFKSKLIKYNMEDCEALAVLHDVLLSISKNSTAYKDQYEIVQTKDLIAKSQFTFLVDKTAFSEMSFINDCAYFDYQQEKVYARKDKQLKKAIQKRKTQKKSFYHFKPNKQIVIDANICSQCGSVDIKKLKTLSRKIADIKFSKTGVKRHIIEYHSAKYRCAKCKTDFIPSDYGKITLRVGHGLIVWVMYQHIVNNQSFRRIEQSLLELFDLSFSITTLFDCKKYFIRFYLNTYNSLLKNIIGGSVIYADETPFLMQFEKGYGWVFTNNKEVISFYKPTREGKFLQKFLEGFEGVLVTDFYSAYDSIECLHQKCLIHLIRDFNSDLIRNPFNEEFKLIAKDFTTILQDIVSTIDKRGLKQYFLNKHIKSADSFLKKVKTTTYTSEVALAYQKRILKNKTKLFEFLKHDDVSWNNNNAEHAIKLLALHANKNMNTFRASRIDDYLKIISIYQTCEYRNISFLKFLLSKETDLDVYCKNLFGV